MKKSKNSKGFKIAKIAVTCAVVLLMTVTAFIIPLRPERSETEKRKLAEFPKFDVFSLLSGDYYSRIAAWFSDTVPFRDELLSVNAKIQNLLGTATVLRGFNEGVAGDEIPDIPETQPQETVSAAEPVTQETSSEPVTEAPTTQQPTTQPPTTEPPTESEETSYIPPESIQKLSSIVIYKNAGYEYYNFVQDTAEKYAAAVNRAADVFDGRATVYSMIIPTSADIMLDKSVRANLSVSDQQKAIAYMESLMSAKVCRVSIFETMKAHNGEYIYFRTDHHWTGLGAYYAYRDFCAVKGTVPVELDACTKRSFDNFLGSFYNDSGMDPALGNTPDVVDTYMPPVNASMTVTDNSGNTFAANVIYDATTNRPAYKYSAFIYGDNQFSVIENLDKTSGESCLLIKDSFGNAIAPLLIYNYKYVYILDYRHYSGTARELVDRYGITDVLFTNNISMTRDKNQVQILTEHIG